MNLSDTRLGKFFARLGIGRGLLNPTAGEQNTGGHSRSSEAGISISDERALQISTAWACTEIITNSVASLPLQWNQIDQKNPDEREALPIMHPISRLFTGRPNKYQKLRDFRRALTMQLALWNNAYAKIDWSSADEDAEPIAITPLHPARMTVLRDAGGLTYVYQTETERHAWAAKSILHLKGIGSEGMVGINRLDAAGQTLGLAASAQKYAGKQFANGGRPGGVLKIDAFLKKEQREKLKELYEGIQTSAETANSLWVLEGGTDYVATQETPDKMQMIQAQEFNATEIARFFGVPAVMIGAGSGKASAWPASFEQQVLAFLTFTLRSYTDEWETGLHDALVPIEEKRRIVVDHDEDDFIRMDSTAKANFLSRLAQNGFITRNEGRRKLKLPKIETELADELTIQTNLSDTLPEGSADNVATSQ